MGLAERRAMTEIQEKEFPAYEKSIQDAAGSAVKLTVKWDTLAVDGYAHVYKNGIEKVFITPLTEALKSICADDMGKKAFSNGIKEIVIQNSENFFSPKNWNVTDGVLTLDHNPISNVDQVADRQKALIGLLEKSL